MIDFRQQLLSQIAFQHRVHYSKNELKLWAAIESDSRIKVINLNVKLLTKEDMRIALFGLTHRNYPCLLFKFQCPCGEVRTELFRLPTDWKSNVPYWERFLSTQMHKHLQDEGFI